jgi:hypothetical protein
MGNNPILNFPMKIPLIFHWYPLEWIPGLNTPQLEHLFTLRIASWRRQPEKTPSIPWEGVLSQEGPQVIIDLFSFNVIFHMGMDQYLLIPFLMGWTSIYQLFWCSLGVQGFDTLPYIANIAPKKKDIKVWKPEKKHIWSRISFVTSWKHRVYPGGDYRETNAGTDPELEFLDGFSRDFLEIPDSSKTTTSRNGYRSPLQ